MNQSAMTNQHCFNDKKKKAISHFPEM